MFKTTFNRTLRRKKNKEYFDYSLPKDYKLPYNMEISTIKDAHVVYPETWYQLHSHQFYTILWFFEGGGVHVVDDVEYDIKPNRIFFLSPSQLHTFKNTQSLCHNEIEGIVIAFAEEIFNLLQTNLAEYVKYALFLRHNCCLYGDIEKEQSIILRDILNKLETEANNGDVGLIHQCMLGTYFSESILQSIKYCQWNIPINKDFTRKSYITYLNFIALVEKEYCYNRSVKLYANKLGVSVVLLTRYVKQYGRSTNQGSTPLEIINRRIMSEAKRLIKNMNLNIAQIAERLGFSDTSNFSKFFKKNDKHHRTPSEYRSGLDSYLQYNRNRVGRKLLRFHPTRFLYFLARQHNFLRFLK